MSDRITFAATVTAEGRRIRGSVNLAGARTWRNNEWLEVDPAALVAADASDVVARWEHDPHKILGRTANDTVSITRTDQGFSYETAELPNTTYADDALELVRGGYVTGSSFEIDGLRSAFATDEDGTRVRRIVHIDRLLDVSPTAHPAFAESTAAAFTKESEMTKETPPEEPEAPEAPAPEVRAKVSAKPETDVAQFKAAARGLSNEQLATVMDNIMAESKGDLKGELLARYEAFAEEYGERTKVTHEEQDRASRMKALHDLRLGRIPTPATESGLIQSDDYREAFATYLRTGNESSMAQFAQAIAGDGTQGGFTVPDGFLNKITERQKDFGGIAALADEITTGNGESLRWPSNDDTANTAAIATEGSAAGSAGADLVFGSITLGAFTFDATGTSNAPLKVSRELVQDSAIDIEGFVARKLGERIGRKQAAAWATGVGTTEPFGLLAKTPDTMTATKTRAAAVEHVFQIDPAYRNGGNARWVMSDTTLAKYWGATDLNGRPLFQPEAQSGLEAQPGSSGRLMGYPVHIDNGAGNLVAFGDIKQGYIVRRVKAVEVLVDPYSANAARQITYHAWARADGNVQDSFAVSVSDYASVTADATA